MHPALRVAVIVAVGLATTRARLFSQGPQLREPSIVALRGMTLIDGTRASPWPRTTIVISRGRLARIQADSAPLPAGAVERNLTGRFVTGRPTTRSAQLPTTGYKGLSDAS